MGKTRDHDWLRVHLSLDDLGRPYGIEQIIDSDGKDISTDFNLYERSILASGADEILLGSDVYRLIRPTKAKINKNPVLTRTYTRRTI